MELVGAAVHRSNEGVSMLQDIGTSLGFLVMVTAPALLVIRRVRVRDTARRTAYRAQLQH